jgi:hypothetical protein
LAIKTTINAQKGFFTKEANMTIEIGIIEIAIPITYPNFIEENMKSKNHTTSTK